jgi:hypothetical protein
MSSFFSKVTGSALQMAKQSSAQIISSVKAIASTVTIQSPAPVKVELSKKEEMEMLYKEICSEIDGLAMDPTSDSIETDYRLSQSDIRSKLKKIVEILQSEGEIWLRNHRRITEENNLAESVVPCIDHFIHLNIVSDLCNRAMSDIPKGIMRLVLTALSTILRSVAYPLLPHQSVHRPIGKLIFIASRYDTMINTDLDRRTISSAEIDKYAAYQRRIGK